MENKMQVFSSEQFGNIRAIMRDGEPWFVGKDVAMILGYTNPRKAVIDHVDDDDKKDGVTIRDSIRKEVSEVLGYSNPLKAIRYHVDKDDKGVNESFAPREAEQLIRRHERELAECSGVVKAAPAPWMLQ